MCIACSSWWYCTDSDMTSEEFCPSPGSEGCKDNKCTCVCHPFFSKLPEISVTEKYRRYTSYLSPKEKEWAHANFVCKGHRFPSNPEDGKRWGTCPYCGTEPIICTGCNYQPMNREVGRIATNCSMQNCSNNPKNK